MDGKLTIAKYRLEKDEMKNSNLKREVETKDLRKNVVDLYVYTLTLLTVADFYMVVRPKIILHGRIMSYLDNIKI